MFEYELTDIIGCSCTLLIPYRGRTEGFVVADYGEDIVVKLRNGKEIVERRDDVLVYD
nr:ribonuclease P [Prevotella sp.]